MEAAVTIGPPGAPPDVGAAELPESEFQAQLVAALPAAYGYALRLCHHRADAEDLVQEAALLAFRGRGGFESGTNFKAWYFRIVTNCFRGRHRQEQRRPRTVDFDDAQDLDLRAASAANGVPFQGDDPASLLIDRIGTERVADALARLPDEFRVACALYFMEDFAYHEIAEILGVPVGTVRSRLHRGRKMLQKSLWRGAEDAGIVPARAGSPGSEVVG